MQAAGRFLASEQSEDGAWRSRRYAVLRDGLGLTPGVVKVLYFLRGKFPEFNDSYRRGMAFLASIDPESPGGAGPFPVYTAATILCVLNLDEHGVSYNDTFWGFHGRERPTAWMGRLDGGTPVLIESQHDALKLRWLSQLNSLRFGTNGGWSPDDLTFGGWGYGSEPPQKPPGTAHDRLGDANLSATLFGLGGWRAARKDPTDPVFEEALRFVSRCQNFAESPGQPVDANDDGGFFFSPVDDARNKAGTTGTDELGRLGFASYGSATADGLRALTRCGLAQDHPRVRAAQRWLEGHFRADTNPGQFARDREVLRDAYYFYYGWSVAHAFTALNRFDIDSDQGKVRWAELLANELLNRQRPDGSWSNGFSDAKEDDPLVATPLAVGALFLCRHATSSAAGSSSDLGPCAWMNQPAESR